MARLNRSIRADQLNGALYNPVGYGAKPSQLRQRKCAERRTGGDGDVLYAVDGEGHGRGIDGCAALEVPEGLSVGGVESDEVAFGVAREYQATCGRENSGPRR